jgi:hypothetical protein
VQPVGPQAAGVEGILVEQVRRLVPRCSPNDDNSGPGRPVVIVEQRAGGDQPSLPFERGQPLLVVGEVRAQLGRVGSVRHRNTTLCSSPCGVTG